MLGPSLLSVCSLSSDQSCPLQERRKNVGWNTISLICWSRRPGMILRAPWRHQMKMSFRSSGSSDIVLFGSSYSSIECILMYRPCSCRTPTLSSVLEPTWSRESLEPDLCRDFWDININHVEMLRISVSCRLFTPLSCSASRFSFTLHRDISLARRPSQTQFHCAKVNPR